MVRFGAGLEPGGGGGGVIFVSGQTWCWVRGRMWEAGKPAARLAPWITTIFAIQTKLDKCSRKE